MELAAFLPKITDKSATPKLGVDEIHSDNGAIRRAYNVNNIKISPIAVSQVYKPAGTIGDIGDKISDISVAQLFNFVNKYFPDILPESVLRHYGYEASVYRKFCDQQILR